MIALPAGEVHVWRVDLDADDIQVADLVETLAPEELERAAAFRFERDRRRFIVGRGLLRALLAAYVDGSPAELSLRYGRHGKPELDAEGAPRFNVTHSGGLALFAFSAAAVGVDVEIIAAEPPGVAERVFSPRELAELRTLDGRRRDRGFLCGWTRKEAFVKARGDGLSLPLDAFDVSLDPDAPCALLRTSWERAEARRWELSDISTSTYVAAVAVEARGWHPVVRQLDPHAVFYPTTTPSGAV